ncbi:MAG TPA: acyl-CoA dehydrogenase [Nevskiaceae bacterium]|nr:acyl-CoA dehydrogenase [Nevskiaceae bacterium]
MDFRPTDEQRLLTASAHRWVSGEASLEQRRERAAGRGADPFARFGELGWLAMSVPESHGGLGSSLGDLVILCEELGRGLVVDSFIAGSVLPARVLRDSPSGPVRDAWLSACKDGAAVAVALFEPGRRYEVQPAATAQPVEGGFRLTGTKIAVERGATAEHFIVGAASPEGPVLVGVDARSPGVARTAYRRIDDVEVADLSFDEVPVHANALIAGPLAALPALESALDDARLCLCADVLGSMERALVDTALHLQTRRQFGKALSEFQVLQHDMAELFIETNDARSILYHALGASGQTRERYRKAVSACSLKVLPSAKAVAGQAVHLHGGMGVTCELAVGHCLRRATVAERLLGDFEFHLARYLG